MDNTKVVKTYCPVSGKHFALEVLKVHFQWKVVNMVDITDEEASLTTSEVKQDKFYTNDNLLPCNKCGTRLVGGCNCQRNKHDCRKNSPYDFMCIYCKEMKLDYSLPTGGHGKYKPGDVITLSQGKEVKIVTFSNVSWTKFDNVNFHDPAPLHYHEPKVHVKYTDKNIEFHGYNVSSMDEGVYYRIPKTDDFTISCDVDTSKIKPHPGGHLYINLGIISARISQTGGTFLIDGKEVAKVGSRFDMVLSLTEHGKYQVTINGELKGEKFVQSRGDVEIRFGFTHDRHYCEQLSHAYIKNIDMSQGYGAEEA